MRSAAFFALSLLVSGPAYAARLPDYFTIPKELQTKEGTLVAEDYGEAELPLPDVDTHVVRGAHWHAEMMLTGVPEDMEDNDVWAHIKPALAKGGWTFPGEFDVNPFHATMRYQKQGKDSWAHVWLFAANDLRLDIIEVCPPKMKHVLKPPAAKPEKIADETGDFPFLAPLPGSKLHGGQRDTAGFYVTLPGTEESLLVAPATLKRDYEGPPGLSNLLFVTVYREALKAAGWTIILESQGINQGDAVLIAHYSKNGRDIWTYMHTGGTEYSISIGDAGAVDLASQLERECHVALYGVLFDFDKATIKPDSETILTHARDALKSKPALAIEVQGHTDNVGNDDYNVKLSQARAESVMKWLTSHGIPAAKLTAKGYGKRVPVASNDDDNGRAKNRRVELSCKK